MRFQPHLADGFESREAMRAAAVEMRLAGHSRSQIAKALGFKTGGRSLNEWLRDVPPPDWTKRPRAKDDLREIAVAMRLEGRSYREIKNVLSVSKSSLSLWLRDVPLVDSHRQALAERRRNAGQRRADTVKALRIATQERVVTESKAQIPDVAESEFFVAGVVAYWAEGTKNKPWRRSEQIIFMNSDPKMILLFLHWLGLVGIGKDRLSFRVSIHESANVASAVRFWSRIVGTREDEFQKTTLKRHNPKTVRRNVGDDYHGCLTIRVRRSTHLYRQIEGWFEGIVASLEKLPA
jgi:hypothetical protein